ncbi:MAG: hypothetical protein GY953_14290, partial [bacterium]|nr:hypothetical protein [bacterium]
MHTIRALQRATLVQRPLLLVHKNDEARVRPRREGLQVSFLVHDVDDGPQRPRLRKARKWGKEGWRGGLLESYFVCESGNPMALWAAFEQLNWPAAVLVPAEAAFLDPALVDEMVRAYSAGNIDREAP